MLKCFFDISTGFRFPKVLCGSVPSIPVAVLDKDNSFVGHAKKEADRYVCIRFIGISDAMSSLAFKNDRGLELGLERNGLHV